MVPGTVRNISLNNSSINISSIEYMLLLFFLNLNSLKVIIIEGIYEFYFVII